MIDFQFELVGAPLNTYDWILDKGYIEADFAIYVAGQQYLEAQKVNMVELAIQLGKWLDSVRQGVVQDFTYDSVLQLILQGDEVQLQSSFQKLELSPLPFEEVKQAVLGFLIALSEKLYEFYDVQQITEKLMPFVSENRKAILLLEQNEAEAAFDLLQKLAVESPSVQSLNNLAWFYLREKEDKDEAEKLLEQALAIEPQSPFPYMMHGEIALHKGEFERAKHYLKAALAQGFTEEATFNLALAHFRLGEYVEAAEEFTKCEGDSGITQLHEVVAWMYAGETMRAKALLDRWNDEAYDYTGAIEIADVYVELGCFSEAREQFEKEWNQYICSPYVVSRFAYTLHMLGDIEACKALNESMLQKKLDEIADNQEAELDEHWSATDKAERMEELALEKEQLETLFGRLQNGYVPAFEYDMYPMGGCQLFGCMRHGNKEYMEV